VQLIEPLVGAPSAMTGISGVLDFHFVIDWGISIHVLVSPIPCPPLF
jgi:hypothetical protein